MTSEQKHPSPVYVALDFETSDYKPDSACALGLAKVEQGHVTSTFYALIRPPRRRMLFTHIHGILWEDVKDAPTFEALWPEIADFLQGTHYLVAHNAPFDRGVLKGCCETHGIVVPTIPFLCTLRGSRRHLQLPSHRLDAVCAHCGIELQHHHAASDALAAANILMYLHRAGVSDEDLLLRSAPSRKAG